MHRTTKKPELNRQEWDFHTCPKEEHNTCLHYEYAREFVRGRPDLAYHLIPYPRPQPYGHPLVFIMSKETNQDGLPLLCADFPEKPWLSIPQKHRDSLIYLCKPLPEEDPDDPSLLVPDDFDVALLQKWDEERRESAMPKDGNGSLRILSISENYDAVEEVGEGVGRPSLCNGPKRYYAIDEDCSYAVIRLDWARSSNQLIQAFKRLLEFRPEKGTEKKNKRFSKVGRGLATDRFNWLVAKRFYRHYGTCDAAMVAMDAAYAGREDEAPYTNVKALGDAVRKFDDLLADLTKDGRFGAFDVFDRQRKN